MNIVTTKVNTNQHGNPNIVTIPIAVPDLTDVRAFAGHLYAKGQEYSDIMWGWPVQYDPALHEEEAEFQIPDQRGGYQTEIRPFWSPASFTIGESGVWFFSLLWENGNDQPPVEFLDMRNSTNLSDLTTGDS